jgi:hypothetical protein
MENENIWGYTDMQTYKQQGDLITVIFIFSKQGEQANKMQ